MAEMFRDKIASKGFKPGSDSRSRVSDTVVVAISMEPSSMTCQMISTYESDMYKPDPAKGLGTASLTHAKSAEFEHLLFVWQKQLPQGRSKSPLPPNNDETKLTYSQ